VLILTVIQGPDKGRKFELPDHEPQLIGRSSEALPIDDNAVSRRHAELTPDDGVWYIRDLESQNGTYLNGVKLDDRTRLRPGDQIRTGQTLFVFGQTDARDPDVVRVVGNKRIDSSIEKTLPSVTPVGLSLPGGNDDSVILSEPEPRAAAVDHLRVIYRLTTMLTTRVMDRQQLLQGVMDLIFAEFSPQRGCIMLTGPTPGSAAVAEVVKYKEPPLDPDDAKIHVSRTILQHAMEKGEGVLSTNAMSDPRFASGDSVQRLNIRSAICSPIRFRERTYGAIYIDSSMANYTFTAEQLALMNAIGQHAGLALSNAELYQQKLQGERLAAIGETVASLSHAIKNILHHQSDDEHAGLLASAADRTGTGTPGADHRRLCAVARSPVRFTPGGDDRGCGRRDAPGAAGPGAHPPGADEPADQRGGGGGAGRWRGDGAGGVQARRGAGGSTLTAAAPSADAGGEPAGER